MLVPIKRLFFAVSLNAFLFILLIIGIQNSSIKSKVNLLIDETVSLPVGFIIGSSFITGSLLGSLLKLDF
tara:strand:- start:401 stop:610 length:210 start_codon:yes stop_codon:yes gene_type:complete